MASSAIERVKRPAMNVLRAMASSAWAILPEKLDVMIEIARRENFPVEALEKQYGEPLEHTYMATVRDGVATIPIEGPMFKRADFFSRISGATSYADIANDFTMALEDPEVTAIILSFDTPGGEVTACSELARMIYDARGTKPIIAYAEGLCASAGFWLASACDEIVAADTALIGSLGCILALEITTKQDEMLGIEHIDIVSSQTPNKRVDPTKAAGRAKLQVLVDDLAGVFLGSVAEFRGEDPTRIAEQYGAGDLLVGASALASGLADRIGSYEQLMAELTSDTPLLAESGDDTLLFPAAATAAAASGRPNTTPLSETAMSTVTRQSGRRGTKPPAAAATADTPDPAAGEQEDGGAPGADVEEEETVPPPATPPATPAAPAESQQSAIAKAVAKERGRVLAIQKLGRPGEEAIVAACVDDPACTPEMAAFKLRSAEASGPAAYLAALAGDESGAPAPAASGDSSSQLTEIEKVEASIVNAGKAPASPSAQR